MKKKTRGTVTLVYGIICVLCEVLLIILNLAFKYDFDGRTNMLSNIILLALGNTIKHGLIPACAY